MIKPFGFIKKKVDKDPMKPKYVKPDGTKVIEQKTPNGKTIYEIATDGAVICLSYDKTDKIVLEWVRHKNMEVGKTYDEYKKLVYEYTSLYDENNTLAQKTEIHYEYYDDGIKSKEIKAITPDNIKIEIFYDEKGKLKEKIETKGSVKTWYDINDKPIKRETDRGSGGKIIEEF